MAQTLQPCRAPRQQYVPVSMKRYTSLGLPVALDADQVHEVRPPASGPGLRLAGTDVPESLTGAAMTAQVGTAAGLEHAAALAQIQVGEKEMGRANV